MDNSFRHRCIILAEFFLSLSYRKIPILLSKVNIPIENFYISLKRYIERNRFRKRLVSSNIIYLLFKLPKGWSSLFCFGRDLFWESRLYYMRRLHLLFWLPIYTDRLRLIGQKNEVRKGSVSIENFLYHFPMRLYAIISIPTFYSYKGSLVLLEACILRRECSWNALVSFSECFYSWKEKCRKVYRAPPSSIELLFKHLNSFRKDGEMTEEEIEILILKIELFQGFTERNICRKR